MKKLEKYLMTTLLAGLVTTSSALALPTQIAQAIGTSQIENNTQMTKMSSNGTVTTSTERLDRKVMVKQGIAEPGFNRLKVECPEGFLATGGGYSTLWSNNKTLQALWSGPDPSVQGWDIAVENDGNANQTIFADVVCLRIRP